MEQANLKIRISADSTQLSSGLKKASIDLSKFYGAISGAAVMAKTKQIIDQASALSDLSKKTGISTTALQAWSYAAKMNGADINTVASAFKNLQKATVDALGGGGERVKAFERMGVSVQQLKSLTPEQLFNKVAQSLGNTQAGAQSTSDALTLLGKTGDEMLPAFRDGFAAAADEAQRLGQILDAETIATLDKTGDQIDQLAGRMTTVLAPAIGFIIQRLRDMSDMFQITIGGGAAYLGALSGGASKEEAKRAAYGVADDVIDQRLKDQDSIKASAISLATGSAASPASLGIQTQPMASRSPSITNQPIASDQLSRIGLFRGGSSNAVTSLLQTQVHHLTRAVGELQGIRNELTTSD